MERTILHSDLNNCYASIECLYNPQIRGKPVAVCGDVEARHGIVLAKNYRAKAYGIQTGNPIWMAKQLCPDLVIVPPHYDRYLTYAKLTREIYAEYTDHVEPFGLDESWLDVSGSAGLYGSGRHIADEIRRRIKFELGVTASVGVSYNRIFAKLGSDLKKPDATTVITSENFRETVWPLPVGDLLYVGAATTRKLRKYGVHTIGELALLDVEFLRYRFGKIGLMLHEFANGRDLSPVSNIGAQSLVKSVGNSTTTPRDLETADDVKITLYALCESVSARLREYGFRCSTVQISLRDNQLESFERQIKLQRPTCTTRDIFEAAFALYLQNRPDRPLRSVGVRGCDLLVIDDIMQLSLYEHIRRQQADELLEGAIDHIRGRYGYFAVQRGVMLSDHALSALDAKSEHIIHPVAFLH